MKNTRQIIESMDSEFSTVDFQRDRDEEYHVNDGGPETGIHLSENREELDIEEVGREHTQDDDGNRTTTAVWRKR